MTEGMRHFLFGLASLVAATSVASAEPLSVGATTTPEATQAPSTYLATGVTLGGVGAHTAAGFSADIGEHLYRSLWLHVGAATADDGQLLAGSGHYTQVHAGLEVSSCQRGDRVCGYVGGDVGYAQSQYTAASSGGEFAGLSLGPTEMSESQSGAIGVLRAGLDIGGEHLRWRPGVEAVIAGPSEAAVTQSLVYRF